MADRTDKSSAGNSCSRENWDEGSIVVVGPIFAEPDCVTNRYWKGSVKRVSQGPKLVPSPNVYKDGSEREARLT